MVTEVHIYLEGGGDYKDTKRAMRIGFGEFLEELKDLARERSINWHITACGSRNNTFNDFLTALGTHPDAFNVLLVDSEGLVRKGDDKWEHLFRTENGWRDRNPGIGDEHCHLMVQMMEAWLLSDPDALREFYGPEFNENPIPRDGNIEHVDKERLDSALKEATRKTSKGEYHKIRHGAKLLAKIDPDKVRHRALHCDRLFLTLTAKLSG